MITLEIRIRIEKSTEKGNTHKITHISLDNCFRVPNLISK